MRRIYVIGGCNIDIMGAVDNPLRLRDSNPGKISYSYGGVARNVAENLARLNEDVYLVSVLGNDSFGEGMYRYCEEAGINMTYTLRSDLESTSTYLAVLDEVGDMYTAVVDMEILKLLDKEYLVDILKKIRKEDILVVDTNLEKSLLDYITGKVDAQIYMDPISTKKAEKISDSLANYYFLKPNIYEAEVLSGIKIKLGVNEREVLDYFLHAGVKEIVISLGEDGVLASDGESYYRLSHKVVTPLNATGAGDSFMAAYIWSRGQNLSFLESLEAASAAAIITILDSETVAAALSCDKIEKVKKEMNIKGEKIC